MYSTAIQNPIRLCHFLRSFKMLNIIMDYKMVPQLSTLSLALCHEALVGGGNHKNISFIHSKCPCLNHIFQLTLYARLIQSILPMQNIRPSICSVRRLIRLWDNIHIINFATNDMFPMLSTLSLALVVMYYTPANFSEVEAQRVCK